MKWPLDGVPAGWQVPLVLGLVISVAMLAWSAMLFVRAQRARAQPRVPRQASPTGSCGSF